MSNLLKSRTEIAARVEAKRSRLVEWLKAEVYTDYQTAALVLGAVAQMLDSLVSRRSGHNYDATPASGPDARTG